MMRLLTSAPRAFLVIAAVVFFAGCTKQTSLVSLPTTPSVLNGIVQSGGTSTSQALVGAAVTIYVASAGPPIAVGNAVTNGAGGFSVNVAQPPSSGVYYAVATLNSGVDLVAILGSSIPPFATINELTTVAAAYSMARFTQAARIQGKLSGLQIAAGMNANLVSVATGQPSAVLLASPNADQSNSLRSTRALANLVAGCVQNPSVACPALFNLTTPPGGQRPTTVLQALVNLAHYPAQQVAAIYTQSQQVQPFLPSLQVMPDAWTLTVKVNDSGNDNFLIAGLGNIVFDANGFAWITNNVVAGTIGSTTAGLIVLRPDGRPSDGTNMTPHSPITSGGLLGPGFGIGLDPTGSIWVGDFGWGGVNPTPTGNGSVSRFTSNGLPISPATGYQGGPVQAQGTISDTAGNIWIASNGTDQVFVWPQGDLSRAVSYQFPSGSGLFDIELASDGTVWLSNYGSVRVPSGISHLRFTGSAINLLSGSVFGDGVKGLAIDSLGNIWAPSANESKIYALSPSGTPLGSFSGGAINGPWSVSVDGNDNVWVANFGPIHVGSNYMTASVSEFAGANPVTRPAGLNMGDAISPPTGYTVPSAGSQVLLHNGTPLYGPGQPPCFCPLMRLTKVRVDGAGNVWALNNWKPNFDVDLALNPGGDGVVIFVGIAEPPRN